MLIGESGDCRRSTIVTTVVVSAGVCATAEQIQTIAAINNILNLISQSVQCILSAAIREGLPLLSVAVIA